MTGIYSIAILIWTATALFSDEAAKPRALSERIVGTWTSMELPETGIMEVVTFRSLSFNSHGDVAFIDVSENRHFEENVRPKRVHPWSSKFKVDATRPSQIYTVNRWFKVTFETIHSKDREVTVEKMTLETIDEPDREPFGKQVFRRLID